MKKDFNVSLKEGIDRQEFADSFSSDNFNVYYFSPDSSKDLFVQVDDSFVETFSADSRIDTLAEAAPLVSKVDTPKPQFQRGTPIAGNDKALGDINDIQDRLYYYNQNPDTPETTTQLQAQGMAIQSAENWLGAHYMPFHVAVDGDGAGPNRLEDTSINPSTRELIGNNRDDSSTLGDYNTKYETRYFGKNIDIVACEGGSHPLSMTAPEDEWFRYVYHPDFGIGPENASSETATDVVGVPTGDRKWGDAPFGNYNHSGTRIILRDWGNQSASSAGSLGGKLSLLSRYNNTALTKKQRQPFTSHCLKTLSSAGGLVSGFAKKANLYPFYIDSGENPSFTTNSGFQTPLEVTIKAITGWHAAKPINPETGFKNPTIIINAWSTPNYAGPFAHNDEERSWGSILVPVEKIHTITSGSPYKPKIRRPAGGWGTNLQPFVDANLQPVRMEDPQNSGTFFWAIRHSASAIDGEGSYYLGLNDQRGVFTNIFKTFERAWSHGIVVVNSAGNEGRSYAKRDDAEYNTYYESDNGTHFYAVEGPIDGNISLDPSDSSLIDVKRVENIDKKVYPFRGHWGPAGCKRDYGIDVGAAQNSESRPGLDPYSNRGPGVDILGRGRGTFVASPEGVYGTAIMPADTDLGSGTPLDPYETEFISGTDWSGYQFRPIFGTSRPYPFEKGETVRINSLGHSPKGQQQNTVNPNNIPLGGFRFLGSNVSNDQITISNHGLVDNDKVKYRTYNSQNKITQLTHRDIYYVKKVDDNTIKLSEDTNLNTVLSLTTSSGIGAATSAMEFSITHEQAQEAWNNYLGLTERTTSQLSSKKDYIITNLGSGTDAANQASWNTLLGREDIYSGHNVGSDRWGDGIRYEITNLGKGTDAENQVRWNEYFGINLNTPNTYAVGDQFVSSTFHRKSSQLAGARVKGVYKLNDTFNEDDVKASSSIAGARVLEYFYPNKSITLSNTRYDTVITTNHNAGSTVFTVGENNFTAGMKLVYPSQFDTVTGGGAKVTNVSRTATTQTAGTDGSGFTTFNVSGLTVGMTIIASTLELRNQIAGTTDTNVYPNGSAYSYIKEIDTVNNRIRTPFTWINVGGGTTFTFALNQITISTASSGLIIRGQGFVVDKFTANIPNLSEVARKGWGWGYYSGTSCAAPTVAGKIACMMEEYLHENGRYPTNNEVKDVMLSKAKVVKDMGAPSCNWGQVPNAAFGKNKNESSTPDKVIFSTQDQTSRFPEVLKYLQTARNDFNTETGVVKPDTTGWTSVNKAPVSIKSSTIASISTSPNNLPIKAVSQKTKQLVVTLTQKNHLLNGTRITITGTNQSALNDNVYYVNKKTDDGGTDEYKLYTDSALQVPADNLVPENNVPYSTGGFVVPTHTAIITAAGSGSAQAFTNTSDVKITELNIGDQITFSNTNSDLNNGLYIVKGTTTNSEGNINTITVEGALPLSVSSSTTNIGSPTISLSQISIKSRQTSNSLDTKVVLVNESAQPAGITCKARMTGGQRYHVEVEADRLINIKITDHAGQNRLNLNQLHHEGTITPGKIKALVRQAFVSPFTGEVDSDTLASASIYGYRNNQSSAIQSMNENNVFDVFTPVDGPNVRTQWAAGGADLVEQTTKFNSAVGQELQTSESYNDPISRAFNRDWFLAYAHMKSVKWQIYADGSTSSIPLTDATTGTLNSTTFSDVGGTTRTIQDFWWFGHDINRKDRKGIFCFSLQGTNIPNTDTTFGGLNVNKVGFRRDQAFYSSNQNGNTVWWWHLSANPISGSDIEKLGEGVTNFSIIKNVSTYGKNKDIFKSTAPKDSVSGGLWYSANNAYGTNLTTYDLTLSNIGTATNTTDVVSSAKITRRGNDYYYGPARETSLVTQYDTTNYSTSSYRKPTYDSIDSMDMLGTPPLIAQFKKTNISGWTATNKDLVSTKSITSGAVYPSPVIGLSATNDASDQETGVSLSKYGWNSGFDDTKLSVTTPTTQETKAGTVGITPPEITVLSITSGNIETPIIPANASNFTIGNPVTANITAGFQWQKSEDGIEYKDIESTDSIYTNSNTGQLTVTGYVNPDDVQGIHFRCKVFIDDAIEYTNVVVSEQAADDYASTFYLFAGTGASGTGFGFYDEVVDSFDAGQVSKNPAFSSSVEGRNDGDLAINKGVVYYLYRASNGDLKLQLDGPGSEVTPDANFTLTLIRSVNSSGTGGTAGGSVSTGVPGSANRAATYASGYGFATWTWASANVPSEVAATFNSASSFNPIKVVAATTT